MGRNRKPITWEVEENGCHIVTSHARRPNGYPYIQRGGKQKPIHRYTYEQRYGELESSSIVIRHSCDNPACINIDHLSKGTQQDNMNDKVDRNRQTKGEDAGKAVITEQEAKLIKYFYEGWTHDEIASQYRINRRQVSRIRNGSSWKHI